MNPIRFNLASPNFATRHRTVDRFVCIFADTDEARRLHYQLRYKVFCEETGYENAEAFPENAEHDQYDRYAKHFIVWDRQKQQCAGAMRLVDASATRLPCEEISNAPLEGLDRYRSRAVEFSRLCILSEYRHTIQATSYGHYQPEGQDVNSSIPVIFRQENNEVLLRLVRASFEWHPDVQYCYFIVTGALSRILARFGIPLTQVGAKVQHRGVRIPFRIDVGDALAGMKQTLSDFAAMAKRSPAYITHSDFVNDGFDDEAIIPAFQPPYLVGNNYQLTA